MDYEEIHLRDIIETDKCLRVVEAPFAMFKAGARLFQETNPYELQGKPPLESDKAKIRKLLQQRGLDICKDEIDDFALAGTPLIAIIRRVCTAKINIHVRVEVEEFPAFLIGGGPDHTWVAHDSVEEWDMDNAEVFNINLDSALPSTFGALHDVFVSHPGDSQIHMQGSWRGPRSGVSFTGGADTDCDTFIRATPEAPVSMFTFFSSPYSDCTFTELCVGQPDHPLSDNFNNLEWKSFWDFKTYSPATSFPIGSWLVRLKIESYGPSDD